MTATEHAVSRRLFPGWAVGVAAVGLTRKAAAGPGGVPLARTRRGAVLLVAAIAVATAALGAVAALMMARGNQEAHPDCLNETILPCIDQSADLLIPVAGAPVTLTYSSEHHRLAKRSDRMQTWLDEVGLGGWTLDVIHALDVEAGLFYDGRGTIRSVSPIHLDSGPHRGSLAVAADDGVVHLFNRQGVHVATVDSLDGRSILSLSYDDSGVLREIAGSDGRTLTISHDGQNEIMLKTRSGQQTLLQIDDEGNLERVADVVGATTTINATADGLITDFALPDGGSYRFVYDDESRLVEEHDPLGVVTRWTRTQTDDGYSIVSEDASGATTTWALHESNETQVATLTGPDGLRTTEEATKDRHIVSWPDGTELDVRLRPDPRWDWQLPVMGKARLAVDGVDRLTMDSSVEVDGGAGDPFAAELIRRSWDVGGGTYTQVWDRTDRQVTFTTPEGRVERMQFDDSGRAVGYTSGDIEQRVVYDDDGWLSSMRWGGDDGPQLRFDHDEDSIEMSGPAGITHRWEVDDAGRVTRSQVSHDGDVQITRLDSGAVSVVEPEGGGEGRLSYAGDGRLASFELGGELLRTWKYDAHGRAVGYEDGDGGEVTLTYDAQSRPTRLDAGDDVLDYRWDDSTGNLMAIDGETVQLSQEYQGPLLVRETWSGAVEGTVERTLDDRLRASQIAVNDSEVPLSYDADGVVTGVGSARIERDPASGAIQRISQGELVEERDHDTLGLLRSVDVRASDDPVYRLTLTRDELGRVVERRERTGAGSARVTTMSYDDSGQLVEVTVDGTVTERYLYDELGNRIRANSSGEPPEVSYDHAGRIIEEGEATFAYDAAGRLASRGDAQGTMHFEYDPRGLLREVRHEDGSTVRYEHDGYGRRVRAEADGQPDTSLLYLDEQRPAATIKGGGVESVFGYADDSLTPITMTKDGRPYRIVADDTGSPRLVVNAATGEVAQRLDYEAFGQVLADSSPGFQPFAFGGGIVDPVSGLVRFGHRDYDPSTGKWTAADPILYDGGDTNLYRYVRNDPINVSDPTGLNPRSWLRFCFELAAAGVDFANAWTAGIPAAGLFDPAQVVDCMKAQTGVEPVHPPKPRLGHPEDPRVQRIWRQVADQMRRDPAFAKRVRDANPRLLGGGRHYGFFVGGPLAAYLASRDAAAFGDVLKDLGPDGPEDEDDGREPRPVSEMSCAELGLRPESASNADS